MCIGYVAFMRLVFPWHSKRLMIVESRIDYIPIKNNLIAIMFLTRIILFRLYFYILAECQSAPTPTPFNSNPTLPISRFNVCKTCTLFKELLVNWFRLKLFVVLDNNIINQLILNFATHRVTDRTHHRSFH